MSRVVRAARGTQLTAKVIQPFLAQGVQSRTLQKPILVSDANPGVRTCPL